MRNEIVVQKMADYVRKVLDYCHGYDYATFSADSKLVEACVFNLSQLGELCKVAMTALPPSTRKSPGGRCTACATALSTITRA